MEDYMHPSNEDLGLYFPVGPSETKLTRHWHGADYGSIKGCNISLEFSLSLQRRDDVHDVPGRLAHLRMLLATAMGGYATSPGRARWSMSIMTLFIEK